jgi:hypothetical protein
VAGFGGLRDFDGEVRFEPRVRGELAEAVRLPA